MKKVSIIVLIFNVGDYVRQCLESLMNQTYKNIEILAIVGDTDLKSMAICEELSKKDDRIVFLPHEPWGVPKSRNMGVERATGDYISFVDGDDYVENNMIETLVNALESEDADISIIGKYYYYKNTLVGLSDESIKKGTRVLNVPDTMREVLMNENFFLHLWDKLYKKELFEGIKFRDDVVCEDRLVCCDLLMKSAKTVFVPKSLYYFRQSLDSCSKIYRNAVSSYTADKTICDKILSVCPELNDEVELFLLKENISMIQTAFLYQVFSKEHDREHLEYIKKHLFKAMKSSNMYTGLIVKSLWAAYFPKSFGKSTLKRRKAFLESHEHFSTGTNWEQIFEEQGINA